MKAATLGIAEKGVFGDPAPSSVYDSAQNAKAGAESPLSPIADVDKSPVLGHIAESGATFHELGVSHGLRGVLARHGEQFMVLQVTPDGEAAVAGVQTDLSVLKLRLIAGGQVTDLGSSHGLQGLFVRNGSQFQVLYATPDGERTIPGVMWDAKGVNVTRTQVASIAGAVPTVVVGKDVDGGATPGGVKKAAIDVVAETAFGTLGSASAPRLWVFIDPLCSYSVKAMQALQAFVSKGQVQVAVIPVSLLDYEDQGRSTPAALAMLSKPADLMALAWMRGDLNGPAASESAPKLNANMAAAEAIGLRGTPTLIWRKANGSEGRLDGLPEDWNAVISSMGGENHADFAR
ncbi:hypothetical protein RZS28_18895 (plasmid) [Methylocapsa polymorpha]|uniref:Thiol:disulfide interchange protein DsbG n=1 Tax=Methylocapsa polymorpha TaxID=3080828 RepID=A0ABZ0HX37_9HYPH|nr:hypothetical protein [Methylocapsa sp. RX1]WOJ91798.1 hypothetical protein RZS28_18895 [Methylocapsa sp. RX1]